MISSSAELQNNDGRNATMHLTGERSDYYVENIRKDTLAILTYISEEHGSNLAKALVGGYETDSVSNERIISGEVGSVSIVGSSAETPANLHRVIVNTLLENSKIDQELRLLNLFLDVASGLMHAGLQKSSERILELEKYQDFEEGEQQLSIESAQGFYGFILKFMELGEPLLGVFPAGTLSAEWRIDSNKHLLMEFLDIDTISFAMIGPDEKSSDGKFRLNGRANREEVIKILFERGVAKWPK